MTFKTYRNIRVFTQIFSVCIENRLIFGADTVRRGVEGLDAGTPLILMAGITFGTLALLPFAGAAALRVNLR